MKLMSQQCSSVMADDVRSDIHTLNSDVQSVGHCLDSWSVLGWCALIWFHCRLSGNIQLAGSKATMETRQLFFLIWALWCSADKHRETVSQAARLWMNAHSAFLIKDQNKCLVFSKWSFFFWSASQCNLRSHATAFRCIFNNVGPGSLHITYLETRAEGKWIFFVNTDSKNIRYTRFDFIQENNTERSSSQLSNHSVCAYAVCLDINQTGSINNA